MPLSLIPLGPSQKNPNNLQLDIQVLALENVAQVLYTCPANKTATIESLAWRASVMGGNTQIDLFIKNQRVRRATAAEASLVDTPEAKQFTLVAGETISVIGDVVAGNGTVNAIGQIRELPT